METLKFNILFPVFLTIILTLYLIKVLPNLFNSASLYNDNPEYIELDKQIGIFTFPKELLTCALIVLAFLGVIIWKDVVLYRNVKEVVANGKPLGDMALCSSLAMQMSFAYFQLSIVYKLMNKKKMFCFLTCMGAVLGLIGIICLSVFFVKY